MEQSDRSKAEILGRIKEAVANAEPPTAPPQKAAKIARPEDAGSELTLQCFSEMLQLVGGECHILAGEEAAVSVLRGLLSEVRGEGILVCSDPELEKQAVPRVIEEAGCEVFWQAVRLSRGGISLEQAAKAAIGITTAQAGIADTGTVVLHHTAERGRLAALLPPVHVVFLKRDRVFPDKISYLAAVRQEGFDLGATPTTWVTGPSLTADIEKVLVRGAHGPRRLIVLLH